jgi:cell division protein FtsB
MSLLKYLIPLWAGVFVYVICSVCTGPTGLSAYKQLVIEQQKLQANIDNLANLNKELENSRDALVDDPDTIAMYARDLG